MIQEKKIQRYSSNEWQKKIAWVSGITKLILLIAVVVKTLDLEEPLVRHMLFMARSKKVGDIALEICEMWRCDESSNKSYFPVSILNFIAFQSDLGWTNSHNPYYK